jgi:hypothetical protein
VLREYPAGPTGDYGTTNDNGWGRTEDASALCRLCPAFAVSFFLVPSGLVPLFESCRTFLILNRHITLICQNHNLIAQSVTLKTVRELPNGFTATALARIIHEDISSAQSLVRSGL